MPPALAGRETPASARTCRRDATAQTAIRGSKRYRRPLALLAWVVCLTLAACGGVRAAHQPLAAASTPSTVATPIPTPTYVQAALAVAQSSGAAGQVSVSATGTAITVRDVVGGQPDVTSARNAVFAEAFALQRGLWESLLHPSSVTVIVSAPTVAGTKQTSPLGTCTLTASKDATVLWSAETPLDAWGYVYDSAVLAPALTP